MPVVRQNESSSILRTWIALFGVETARRCCLRRREPVEAPDARHSTRCSSKSPVPDRRGLLGAMVRAVSNDGSAARDRRAQHGGAGARGQGQHGCRAGAGRALPDSLDSDACGFSRGARNLPGLWSEICRRNRVTRRATLTFTSAAAESVGSNRALFARCSESRMTDQACEARQRDTALSARRFHAGSPRWRWTWSAAPRRGPRARTLDYRQSLGAALSVMIGARRARRRQALTRLSARPHFTLDSGDGSRAQSPGRAPYADRRRCRLCRFRSGRATRALRRAIIQRLTPLGSVTRSPSSQARVATSSWSPAMTASRW